MLVVVILESLLGDNNESREGAGDLVDDIEFDADAVTVLDTELEVEADAVNDDDAEADSECTAITWCTGQKISNK